MTTVTHKEIVRLLPGIQDHTALEIAKTGATLDELEAAVQLLQDDDESLIEVKREAGSHLNRLLEILSKSEILLRDDVEP